MDTLGKDSLRIVQADDDSAFRKLTEAFVHRAGYTRPFLSFPSGNDLVEFFDREGLDAPPEVIILDLNMPGMDGVEVIRWLRKNHPSIPSAIYMMTSSDNPIDICNAALSGATKYFLKSGRFDQLIEEMDRLNRRDRRENLQGAKAELAIMGEHAPQMVIITDIHGHVEWVNENFVKGCGYTLAEIRGKKPGEVLQGPQSDPRAIEQLHRAIDTRGSCSCEIVNYRKDGTPYPAHISLGPVYDGDRLEGFLAVAKDVTSDIRSHAN
jgi:PAS domain S-box-containing protein